MRASIQRAVAPQAGEDIAARSRYWLRPTPGPAAPPICRANEMPWSAEWASLRNLGRMHPLTCFCTCCPLLIREQCECDEDDGVSCTGYEDIIHTQSLISHSLGFFASVFCILLASFASSVCRCKDQILCHRAKPRTHSLHNKARRLSIPDSTVVSTPYIAWPGLSMLLSVAHASSAALTH